MSFLLSTCRRSRRNDDVQPPLSGYAKWTHRLQKELVKEKEGEVRSSSSSRGDVTRLQHAHGLAFFFLFLQMSHIIKIPIDDELRLGEYMALDQPDPKEEVLPETIENRKLQQLDAISHWIRVSNQNTA